MRMLRAVVPWLLLVTGAVSAPAGATPPASVVSATQASLLTITESTRYKLMTAVTSGDIAGAITLYEVHVGHRAPAWLRNLQVAYSAASQRVGQCQEVARLIHTAFSKLGRQPQYIAIRAQGRNDYMTFDLPGGSVPTVTRNGYHVAVMLDDIVYDAYTGPLGMKLTEYFSRLQAPAGVTWKAVSTP